MRKASRRFVSSITITCVVVASLFGFIASAATASASPHGATSKVSSAATGRGAAAGALVKPVLVRGKWHKHGWVHPSTVPANQTAAYHLWKVTQHGKHATTVTNHVAKKTMAKATKKMAKAAGVQPFTAAPSPDQAFEGLRSNNDNLDPLNFGDNWAPNPSADVSPDYYVQTVDFSIGVFDKSGNLLGAQELEDLFSNVGTTTTGTSCDYSVDDALMDTAQVAYDSQTDRWIVAASEWSDPNFQTGPQFECIAVSTSGNPMGSYNVYPIQLSGSTNTEFDAQDIGLWGDGLYAIIDRSCNDPATNTTIPPCPAGTVTDTPTAPNNADLVGDLSSQVFAFNKSDLESGAPLRWQTTTGIPNSCTGANAGKCGTMDAQELYGWLAATDQTQTGMPAAGTPEYFMTQDDNVNNTTSGQFQNFVRYTVDWNTPANSLIVGGNKVLSASKTSNTVTVNFSAADNYVTGDSFLIENVGALSTTTPGSNAGICTNAVIVTTTQLTCTEASSATQALTTPGAAAGDIRLVLQPAANYAYHYDSSTNGVLGDYQEPAPGNNIFGNYNQAQPKLRYVNFGGTEQLWWGEATNAGSSNSVANAARASWFRVNINSATRAVTNGASSYYNNSESPITVDRFNSSLALDKNGNMLMGYNTVQGRSGATASYAGIRYAGRLSGDAIGAAGASTNTTQTETALSLANSNSYIIGTDPADPTSNLTSFGGNAIVALDPDGCHFWLSAEYFHTPVPTSAADDTYNMRVAEIHYPSCTPSTLATSLSTSGVAGSPGILTATLTSDSTGSSGIGGKTITFKLDGNPVGSAVTNDYGVATLTGVDASADPSGNNPGAVQANFAGAGEYVAAAATGDLNKNTDQTITFGSLSDATIGDAATALTATASSGLAVTYTAAPTNRCQISGGTNLSVAGGAGFVGGTSPGDQGDCTVTAHQAGDGTYNPAPDVSQTLTINGQAQTINITGTWQTDPHSVAVVFTASATATSGLPVGFQSDGVNCDVSGAAGTTITPSHTGSCNLTAVQVGNDTYAPVQLAAPTPVTGKANQTCAIAGTASRRIDQASPLATAVTCTPSGLNADSFTVTASQSNVATVAASTAFTIAPAASSINVADTRSDTITTASTSGMNATTTVTYTCGTCGANDVVGQTVVAAGITGGTNLNGTFVVTAVNGSTTVTVGTGATSSVTGATYAGATLLRAGAREVGTTATINTTTAHGILATNGIVVAGVTPSGYNGPWTVATAPFPQGGTQSQSATLTYTDPTSGLANSSGVAGTVTPAGSGATESGNTVTLTTTAAHGLAPGASIKVRNVGVAGYNGDFTTIAPTSGTTITYTVGGSPNALAPSGGGNVATAATGASETVSGTTVTLNTTAAHGLGTGATIVVSGVGVGGYNGTYVTEAPTSGTVITYEDVANPGLNSSGAGAVATTSTPSCTVGGTPGAETVTALHTGTCTVTAGQSGNADYNAAPPVSKTFTWTAGNQTITFSPTTTQNSVPPFVVTATLTPASAGADGLNPGNVTSTTPAVCGVGSTTNGTGTSVVTVTPVAAGTCTLSAAGNAGNVDFSSRAATTQNITIVKTAQSITFGALGGKFTDDADFGVSATASSGLTVAFTSTTGTVCTVTGSTVHIVGIVGTCTIAANQAGNALYNAATQVTQSFSVIKHNQTISFGALPNKTFGDPDFSVSATASSGLSVTFIASGNCTVTPDGLTTHLTGAGSCTITAQQAGNFAYNAAPDVPQSFSISKSNQTISFGALGSKTTTDPDFSVSATASSSLAVSFSASGNCTVTPDGLTTHLVGGAGSCSITAHQAGDANYNAASDVTQSFNIFAAGQTISFANPGTHTYLDPNFAVSATATSNLAVSFTATGQCTVTTNGSSVHLTGAGSCTITAHQAGDINYAPAPDVPQMFTINQANQTINGFAAIPNHTYGDVPFNINGVTATSGLSVTFTASGNCTVTSAGHVVITSGGSCTVTAHQAGNVNYNAAPDVAHTFSIAAHATTTQLTLQPSATRHVGQVVKFVVVGKAPPGTLKPAGVTVDIKIDSIVVASGILNTSGKVTITYTVTQTVGNHNVQASLVATPNFATSNSLNLALHVNP